MESRVASMVNCWVTLASNAEYTQDISHQSNPGACSRVTLLDAAVDGNGWLVSTISHHQYVTLKQTVGTGRLLGMVRLGNSLDFLVNLLVDIKLIQK